MARAYISKKSIRPLNEYGEYHGYHEWYTTSDDKLWVRVVFKNNLEYGYEDIHNLKRQSTYYIR